MGKGLQRGCCQETPTGLEWSSLHVEASGFSKEVLPVSRSPSSYRHLSQSYTAPSLRHPVSLPASLPLQCDRHHGHQGHDPPLVSPYARSAPPKDFTLYLPDLHTSTHAFVIYWALSLCVRLCSGLGETCGEARHSSFPQGASSHFLLSPLLSVITNHISPFTLRLSPSQEALWDGG